MYDKGPGARRPRALVYPRAPGLDALLVRVSPVVLTG
jgi:hypothetical protein